MRTGPIIFLKLSAVIFDVRKYIVINHFLKFLLNSYRSNDTFSKGKIIPLLFQF
jgi:hypothetical protein